MSKELTGRKVAYITEGFKNCEADVKSVVMDSLKHFREAGVEVEEVSLPWHTDGRLKRCPCPGTLTVGGRGVPAMAH